MQMVIFTSNDFCLGGINWINIIGALVTRLTKYVDHEQLWHCVERQRMHQAWLAFVKLLLVRLAD